jgi:hypothetical protein
MNKIVCTILFLLVFIDFNYAQTFEAIVDSVANQICICVTKDTTIKSLDQMYPCMISLDSNKLKISLSRTDSSILIEKVKELGAYNPKATLEDNQGYYFGYLLGKKMVFICPKIAELFMNESKKN